MNTLTTVFTGLPLEGFHGKWRVMIIFETSVICGGIWHMAWRPDLKNPQKAVQKPAKTY